MRTLFLFSIAAAAVMSLLGFGGAWRLLRDGYYLGALLLFIVGLMMIAVAVNLAIYVWREWRKALRPLSKEPDADGVLLQAPRVRLFGAKR